MAENYKHLYEQTKTMLAMYQDELIPGFRKQIEELEKNQIKVRCKDCAKRHYDKWEKLFWCAECDYACNKDDWFCAGGEKVSTSP